jgi:hypothetical protein
MRMPGIDSQDNVQAVARYLLADAGGPAARARWAPVINRLKSLAGDIALFTWPGLGCGAASGILGR